MADFIVSVTDNLVNAWITAWSTLDDGSSSTWTIEVDWSDDSAGVSNPVTAAREELITMNYSTGGNYIANTTPTSQIRIEVDEGKYLQEARIYFNGTLAYTYDPGTGVYFPYGGELVIPLFQIDFTTTTD